MIPLDCTDFEETWKVFEQQNADVPPEVVKNIRGIFMSGGFAAVGMTMNRMSKLPGTVDPSDMIKELINTWQVAMAELELKANKDFENKTFGQG